MQYHFNLTKYKINKYERKYQQNIKDGAEKKRGTNCHHFVSVKHNYCDVGFIGISVIF